MPTTSFPLLTTAGLTNHSFLAEFVSTISVGDKKYECPLPRAAFYYHLSSCLLWLFLSRQNHFRADVAILNTKSYTCFDVHVY